MTGDNPFADDDDDLDKTVVRPAQATRPPSTPASPPAAAIPAQQPAAAAPAASARSASVPPDRPAPDPGLVRDPALMNGASVSRLLDAAAPMLALIVATRDLDAHPDPETLLDGAIVEIRGFETRALAAGYTSEQIRLARYALCATMDDVVLATPWGGRTAWNTRGLVSTVHRETMSGERLYALLDTLMAKADEHHDELQLFYVCLSLGFEGKYRIMPRGAAELSRVRDRLYRRLTQGTESFSDPLSPAGAGRQGPWRALGATMPLWVPFLVAAVLLAGLSFLYAADLRSAQRAVFMNQQQFAAVVERTETAVPPPQPAPEPPPAPEPEPVPAEPVELPFERVSRFLAPEIAQFLVEVLDLPGGVAVRVITPDQFGSGGATASATLAAIVRRIGRALDDEEGDIAVLGHTDAVPMRPNARFADNTDLSQARAQAVENLLREGFDTPRPVVVSGQGADVPIADNATPEGRARNRRVEVLLLNPEASLPQVMLQMERLAMDGGVR